MNATCSFSDEGLSLGQVVDCKSTVFVYDFVNDIFRERLQGEMRCALGSMEECS